MNNSVLKGTLGQIGDLGKQLGKGVLEETKKTVRTTVQQVGLEQTDSQKKDQKEMPQRAVQDKNKDTQDIVKALYGSSERNPQPQTDQKIAALRQQLHRETYFDPTFNSQRKQQEEKIEEQQKEQEEGQKKRWELQEKEQKEKEESAVLQQKKSVEKRPGAG